MFVFLLLIGIWMLLKIGVESLDELIEVAWENQIRGSLIDRLLALREWFEFGKRLMWFLLTLPIRAFATFLDLFDRQTG